MDAFQLTAWQHAPELRQVADPDPGAGEVVVRIGGAGACHSDLHLIHDFPDGMMPWAIPFTLGHENAGWVEAVGPGGSRLEVGAPVAVYGAWGCGRCRRCRQGAENYCEDQAALGAMGPGLGRDGGMAERLLVPSDRYLVPLGDLDPVEAAPLTDAGLTPYHAVKRSLPLLVPGTTAVVIGVGGLGHMAVQILAELSPATIIAVDQRADALARATAGGADHAVLSGEGTDAGAEIKQLTRDKGADLVIDVVGADATLALAAAVARPLGHITIMGIAGGTLPINFFGIGYEVSVATTYWGSMPELIEVVALAAAGRIRPHIQRFTLAEAGAAYEAMHDGTLEGRAVIVPG